MKVNELWKHHPVRRAAATKTATKGLLAMKETLHAYAMARPGVRFSLKVLKANSEKGNWVYAPKRNANMEDVASTIVGRETIRECSSHSFDWSRDVVSSTQDTDVAAGAPAAMRRSIRVEALLANHDAGMRYLRDLGIHILVF